MATPKISVIIPLYNHENFIRGTILSVLNQQIKELEIIVIDDGSKDQSANEVSTISDDRIRFYSQQNCGAHNTINRGIQLAKGKYISILNSDDLYHPERLQKCLHYLSTNRDVDAVFTKVEAIDNNDKHLYFFKNSPPRRNSETRPHPDQLIVPDLLGINITTTTSNIFCRREIFADIGVFRMFRYCHDLDWLLRCVYHKHVRIIPEPLLQYRFHQSNTIKENVAMIYFEVGLILADFMMKHDLGIFFPNSDKSQIMAEISRSLHFKSIDRMLAILTIFTTDKDYWPDFLQTLLQDESDPFRLACLDHINASLQQDEELKAINLATARLNEEYEQQASINKLYEKSLSLKIGRALTWPARRILNCQSKPNRNQKH